MTKGQPAAQRPDRYFRRYPQEDALFLMPGHEFAAWMKQDHTG
ncbi:MAG TPA: hypothetical protein VN887_19550 [Candidatus Angelobacter sp.]|nr:hypothetical protein [Candidatus Angelobacter sp.]